MTKSKFKGPENARVLRLIALLEKTSRKHHSKAWALVAEMLKKPARSKKRGVNLFKIERLAREGDKVIVIPGTVLGEGTLSKQVSIAALRASKSAREKLGAKLVTLEKEVAKNPGGKNTRIII